MEKRRPPLTSPVIPLQSFSAFFKPNSCTVRLPYALTRGNIHLAPFH